ncbi:hypothetical protein NCER_100150 [Vairimorpha ceranae BRL01]|uniref:RING-type domain-containing protein n=2 Tax=Vairimorpha ceranae TaxID=40302 RepID=C4V6V3_VAIC1|nr:ring finger protein 121 [Vairimorpha ceranae]EEQ83061.1 hypothetical protein NCER_100150 [Vairimorpha ceranae BRL01]KKO75093.1 ring finger protein 121 [Vairimorpha ceranae]
MSEKNFTAESDPGSFSLEEVQPNENNNPLQPSQKQGVNTYSKLRCNRYKIGRQTRVVVIEKPLTFMSFLPLVFYLIMYGLILQTICMILKKVSKKTYDLLIFSVLFFTPPLILLFFKTYTFLFIWIAFSSPMVLLYLKIKKKPVDKDLPRKVFNIFKILFMITNLGVFLFQFCTIMTFLFLPSVFLIFFLCFLVFLYFAVLSREIVYFFSEAMATNTGFYSKEGVPNRNNNDTLCMICTKAFDNTEPIHTLICSHSFHENCIKGWCMIAKKNSCPYCKKGVDLETIPKDIWYKSEIWFYPLINTTRGLIVLIISLIITIFYKLQK